MKPNENVNLHSLKSTSATTIPQRLEECLDFVRNKQKIYADAHDMALDYGKYGTTKFFSVWMLVDAIDNDERFRSFLKINYI